MLRLVFLQSSRRCGQLLIFSFLILCYSLYLTTVIIQFNVDRKWRFMCCKLKDSSGGIPSCLQRGWRPRESFAEDVQRFSWARPFALCLDNLPPQLTLEETQTALLEAAKREARVRSKLKSLSEKFATAKDSDKDGLRCEITKAEESLKDAKAYDELLQPPTVTRITELNASTVASAWKAYVQVQNEDVYKQLTRLANSKSGIAVKSEVDIPHVQAALQHANEAYESAKSQSKVYPCAANNTLEGKARDALQKAKLGLRIKFGDKALMNSVCMSRASAPLRGQSPLTSAAMIESSQKVLSRETEALEGYASRIESFHDIIQRLKPAIGKNVSSEVAEMSAFDILEALRHGDFDKTVCPICLDQLGSKSKANTAASSNVPVPIVAMTTCSHFFCISCLGE